MDDRPDLQCRDYLGSHDSPAKLSLYGGQSNIYKTMVCVFFLVVCRLVSGDILDCHHVQHYPTPHFSLCRQRIHATLDSSGELPLLPQGTGRLARPFRDSNWVDDSLLPVLCASGATSVRISLDIDFYLGRYQRQLGQPRRDLGGRHSRTQICFIST